MCDKPYWEGKKYAFFQHKECEFFPCHPTNDPDSFNCLFCYCPLYALGDKCGWREYVSRRCFADIRRRYEGL